MLHRLLKEQYGLYPDAVERAAAGVGSDTYFITCGADRYVLKCPDESVMNRPDLEPELCGYLREQGIPACRFIRNRQGHYLSADENGKSFHLQAFVEGKTYALNAAPDWYLPAAAKMLGRIHTVLREYPGLPTGIGADFFRYMTPEHAALSYRNALSAAEEAGEAEIVQDLRYRLQRMENFPRFGFDPEQLTCTGSHGDYGIHQVICGEGEIRAVIDWTTACVHPVVWEIIRSYVYASPRCAAGCIDAAELIRYVEAYLETAPLTAADIRAMVPLFHYQIAVCDYYSQYFASAAANRHIFLHQAQFSTKLMRWLEKNEKELVDRLTGYFER